jgi:hypothetical protein
MLSHLGDRVTRSARYHVLESRAGLIIGAPATMAKISRTLDTIIQSLSGLYRRLRSPLTRGALHV